MWKSKLFDTSKFIILWQKESSKYFFYLLFLSNSFQFLLKTSQFSKIIRNCSFFFLTVLLDSLISIFLFFSTKLFVKKNKQNKFIIVITNIFILSKLLFIKRQNKQIITKLKSEEKRKKFWWNWEEWKRRKKNKKEQRKWGKRRSFQVHLCLWMILFSRTI